jgi:hypothetical protein
MALFGSAAACRMGAVIMSDYTCAVCAKRFGDTAHLRRHQGRKTPCAPSPAPAGCPCEGCGGQFARTDHLKRHQATGACQRRRAEDLLDNLAASASTAYYARISRGRPSAHMAAPSTPAPLLPINDAYAIPVEFDEVVDFIDANTPVTQYNPLTVALDSQGQHSLSLHGAVERALLPLAFKLYTPAIERAFADPARRNMYLDPANPGQVLVYVADNCWESHRIAAAAVMLYAAAWRGVQAVCAHAAWTDLHASETQGIDCIQMFRNDDLLAAHGKAAVAGILARYAPPAPLPRATPGRPRRPPAGMAALHSPPPRKPVTAEEIVEASPIGLLSNEVVCSLLAQHHLLSAKGVKHASPALHLRFIFDRVIAARKAEELLDQGREVLEAAYDRVDQRLWEVCHNEMLSPEECAEGLRLSREYAENPDAVCAHAKGTARAGPKARGALAASPDEEDPAAGGLWGASTTGAAAQGADRPPPAALEVAVPSFLAAADATARAQVVKALRAVPVRQTSLLSWKGLVSDIAHATDAGFATRSVLVADEIRAAIERHLLEACAHELSDTESSIVRHLSARQYEATARGEVAPPRRAAAPKKKCIPSCPPPPISRKS